MPGAEVVKPYSVLRISGSSLAFTTCSYLQSEVMRLWAQYCILTWAWQWNLLICS